MEKTKKGSGLIFAVVLLFVILGMVVTLSSVTVLETKMNQKTKSSVGAFYGSESGVEWALNQIATKSGTANLSSINNWDATNHLASCPAGVGTCKVYFLDSAGKVMNGTSSETIADIKAVRSVSTQGGETQRAIEAAVAAGGGGCYIAYKTGCSDGPPINSGCCLSGFTNKGSAGRWGLCNGGSSSQIYFPSGGHDSCISGWPPIDFGEGFVCCQN